jgi:hypothetical protein
MGKGEKLQAASNRATEEKGPGAVQASASSAQPAWKVCASTRRIVYPLLSRGKPLRSGH